MLYGANTRYVRWSRILLLMRDPDRKWDFMDEVILAADATDGDMDILGGVMINLINPGENLTNLQDGTPRPNFECARLRLLERHQRNCEAGSQHYSCAPGMTVRRDTVIIEARATNACGDATGQTWQDIVRHLLDLTE
jgi:hypothetical protein